MTTKKPPSDGKRPWRSARSNPAYTDFVIRVRKSDADLIQNAAEAEAERLSNPLSRNNFCVRAIIDAAKKELASPAPAEREEPAERQELASDFPSLTGRKKNQLTNYPCRLRKDQIEALNRLRDKHGALPADLIREFIDFGLRRIKEQVVSQ